MADGKQFDFLSSAWGSEASSEAQAEISNNVETLNRKSIEEYIKDSDIRKLKLTSNLPKELARMGDGQLPPGKYLCQVIKFADITQPTKFQEEGDKKWRLIALDLADSEQKFKAIEYMHIPQISSDSWPGTKLLLHSTNQAPLYVRNSHLLLTPDTVEVLGGEVWKLIENWKASKEVEAGRLLWKTDGVRKKEAGTDGAPPWVDFDPKKASRGPMKSVEEERAQWQKEKSAVDLNKGHAAEREGTRFQAAEFQEEGIKVHSKVASNAFKQDLTGGKGKGGKGKDRGDGEKGGKGKKGKGRRGDDDDDGYQEEKRAPSHASLGLAAFIKPTKDGKMPDEALDLLTKKDPPVKKPAADAGWKEESWDSPAADGWGEASWGEASWSGAADGWNSSGHGGAGRGKGGGGRGKGGGGKGKSGGAGGGKGGGRSSGKGGSRGGGDRQQRW